MRDVLMYLRWGNWHFFILKWLVLQGDQKKQGNLLFLREIIQPNLPKFAYNLFRGRQVRI